MSHPIVTSVVLSALLTAVAPAHAEAPTVLNDHLETPEFEAHDWVGGGLSALVGGVVVGGSGFMLGYGLGTMGGCDNDCDFVEGFAEGVVLGTLLAPAGMAAGTYLYGQARGFDGSYWGALGGAYAGSLLGVGLGLGVAAIDTGDDDTSNGVAVGLGLLTAAVGTTLGYYLTLGHDDGAAPVGPQALVQRDASGAFSLGLPAVGFAQSGIDLTVTITLLGGTL